MLGGIYCSLL